MVTRGQRERDDEIVVAVVPAGVAALCLPSVRLVRPHAYLYRCCSVSQTLPARPVCCLRLCVCLCGADDGVCGVYVCVTFDVLFTVYLLLYDQSVRLCRVVFGLLL